MIKITNIIIEGFGSMLHETDFKLDREGLNVIRGKTGAGKTTIPSALSWCFFGTTLKGKATVPTWEKLRGKDFKGTMVKVLFTKEGSNYEIIRCVSYKRNVLGKTKGGSNLFIIKDGLPIESERNKIDKQKYIEKLIGYSYELFTNSIVFGQKLKRIIEESGPNKKKIFDEAFEVMFIDQAKKKTEVEKEKVTGAINEIESEQSKLEELISDALENYDDAIEFEKSFEKNREKNLSKLRDNRDKLKSKYDKVKSDIESFKEVSKDNILEDINNRKDKLDKIEKIRLKISNLTGEIERLGSRIKEKEYELAKIKPKECPVCKSEISKEKTNAMKVRLNDHIENCYGSLNDINAELGSYSNFADNKKKIQKELGKLQEKLGKQKEKEKNLKELKLSLSNYKDELNSIKEDILAIEKDKLVVKSPKYKDKLVKFKKKNKKLLKEMKVLTSKNDIYKWLIKDPLSNNGLKAYIFDSLLGKVNDKLNELQKHLGFRVEFGIDLESSRKDFYQVIYKDDMIILYPDLSGGQKQLVDFSVALAIHKVISSIRPTNIIFFDEPFEGLDTDCVDIISELITDEAKDKSLFMITHHPNFNPITSNNIHFELDSKGITKIT